MSHLTKMPEASQDKQHTDLIRSLRDMADHLGKDASDAAGKAGSALAHAAADFAEQARKQAGPALKTTGKVIKDHPVTSAAILAAAVGLIGFALTRHHKDDETT